MHFLRKFFFVFLIQFILLSDLLSQQVDGGNGHAIILDEKGNVWTVGRNDFGQIGDSTWVKNIDVPYNVKGLPGIKTVSRGYDHSLAIDSQGNIWAWGRNNYGQLGITLPLDYNYPQRLKHEGKFVAIEGGHWHTVALKEDGSVVSWGHNYYGELGNGTQEHCNYPVPVIKYDPYKNEKSVLTGIVKIASVGYHTLALSSIGEIWAWGANDKYQLGYNKHDVQPFAVRIENLLGIKEIAVGWHHSVALDSLGNIWVWGSDPSGQFNEASTKFIEKPTMFSGLPKFEKIACGSWHSLAIDVNRNVWAWGKNHFGMLGKGDTISNSFPVKIEGLENICEIGGGCFQSLAVDSSGNIWTFGDNPFGQLGINNRERKHLPVKMFISSQGELNVETKKSFLREALSKIKPVYVILGISVIANVLLLLKIKR